MSPLQVAGKARVKAYYDIGKLLKTNTDRTFAKNELKLTDGQMGLAIMLAKFSWTMYQNCVSLFEAKLAYIKKTDTLREEMLKAKSKAPTEEEAQATIAKNNSMDYDYIDL